MATFVARQYQKTKNEHRQQEYAENPYKSLFEIKTAEEL